MPPLLYDMFIQFKNMDSVVAPPFSSQTAPPLQYFWRLEREGTSVNIQFGCKARPYFLSFGKTTMSAIYARKRSNSFQCAMRTLHFFRYELGD